MPSNSVPLHRVQRLACHLKHALSSSATERPGTGLHQLPVASTPGADAVRSGPLKGIRVLDMSSVISGPWATSFLADQGAEVIKIEGPGEPDMTRKLGPQAVPNLGAQYITVNRGKRSIVLDLGKPQGVAVLKRLVAKCDVVVQNFRPGVAKRLGIDYAALSAVKPDLVMLSISGYGPTGPYVNAKVYDQVVQAMTGVPSITSHGDSEPTLFHSLLVDKVTALNAAQSVTAALLAKERGHGGQHVQLSMLDVAVHFHYPDVYWNKVWRDVKPFPVEWKEIALKAEYQAADGKLVIPAADRKQMWGLLEVTGLQEFRSDSLGKMRATAMDPIRAKVRTMSRQELFDKCLEHGVPCGKFLECDEVLADPQIQHNATIEEHVHPDGGRYYSPRPPARFGNTPAKVQGPAPQMGADTAQVLQELGVSSEELEVLKADGIIA